MEHCSSIPTVAQRHAADDRRDVGRTLGEIGEPKAISMLLPWHSRLILGIAAS
jgi:hypothetical protein